MPRTARESWESGVSRSCQGVHEELRCEAQRALQLWRSDGNWGAEGSIPRSQHRLHRDLNDLAVREEIVQERMNLLLCRRASHVHHDNRRRRLARHATLLRCRGRENAIRSESLPRCGAQRRERRTHGSCKHRLVVSSAGASRKDSGTRKSPRVRPEQTRRLSKVRQMEVGDFDIFRSDHRI